MEAPRDVEYLKDDAMIDITLSGQFYKRLQALFVYVSQKKTMQEFIALHANLVQGNAPVSEYDFHLQTLFGILVEIETRARDQKKTSHEPMEEFMKKLEEFKRKQEEAIKEDESKRKDTTES